MSDKTKVTVDAIPNPEAFGWYGLILFVIGLVLVFFIWVYYDMLVSIVAVVLWVVGVYIGRGIESQFYKHKLDEVLKAMRDKDEK